MMTAPVSSSAPVTSAEHRMRIKPRAFPLNTDKSSRFLVGIMAAMIYLATLSAVGIMITQSAMNRWSQGFSGTLTVQILPLSGEETADLAKRVSQVIRILKAQNAVAEVRALSDEENKKLLEPWLGKNGLGEDLPLPTLLDVTLHANEALDQGKLTQALRGIRGVELDAHRYLVDRLKQVASVIRLIAIIIVLLVFAVAVAAVILGTKSSMAIHAHVVELLHLIGAQDRYIAQQFELLALRDGLFGGVVGFGAAVISTLAFTIVSGQLNQALLPPLELSLQHWLALLSLPILGAVTAWLTARFSVNRALKQMI